MHIAFAIPHNPLYNTVGGAVRSALELAEHVDSHDGYSVTVYKIAGNSDEELRSEYGLQIKTMEPHLRLKQTLDTFSPFPPRYTNFLISCAISLDLHSDTIDLLHVHNTTLLRGSYDLVSFGKSEKIPTLLTCHALNETLNRPDLLDMGPGERRLYQYTVLELYRRTIGNCDGVVSFSDEITPLSQHFPTLSVFYGSNGVSETCYRPDPDEAIFDRYDLSYPLVFYSGGFHHSKGIDRVVKLTHKITEGTVAIAGPDTGNMVDEVESRIDNQTGRVLGYIPRDDLYRLYALADVYFYPTRSDNFPLVVLEAMINKTAIVATDIGGISRQLGDAGIVVSDPSAAISETLTLLKDERKKTQLGERARRRAVNEYSWESVASDHCDIYETLVR